MFSELCSTGTNTLKAKDETETATRAFLLCCAVFTMNMNMLNVL